MTKFELVSVPNRSPSASSTGFRLLLPVSTLEEARILLPVGESLVLDKKGQLFILHLHTADEDEPLSSAAAAASDFREALVKMMQSLLTITARIQTRVRPPDKVWEEIWEAVEQEEIDMLLVGWPHSGKTEMTVSDFFHARLDSPPCAVIALRPGEDLIASGSWQHVHNILMPVRGGANSSLTLRVGYSLAQTLNASITLLHVASSTKDERFQFTDQFSPAVYGLERIQRTVTTKGEIPDAVLKEAENHQVIVMGAPTESAGTGRWQGPLVNHILRDTRKTVIAVMEKGKPAEKRPASPSAEMDTPLAVVVDKWFVENTFRSREFEDLEGLVRLKEEQGLTISVGLPALNEEATVGRVIKTIKTALLDEIPLIDEIILIDSGSTDRTREIAEDLGIPVFIHQEILPELGSYEGKGEALWKSLYVLKGDIIAWVDTDISNIHPRFVYGVVGPLLRDTHIHYVKGFYRRPLREGGRTIVGGGGRVTELTARPFINLFFPELSGLIQPLSGEYAGRRSVLERLPFFTGYGVETGLLLDLFNEFGLGAIAQVDLLERVHHNQPLPSLSKMSFAIMQVVFSRLEKRHNTRLLVDANRTMNLIRYDRQRHYYLDPVEIYERERPPMITVPQYCEKMGRVPLPSGRKENQVTPRGVGL
jgi:glucosyl-3-phosphoglycerate synthase